MGGCPVAAVAPPPVGRGLQLFISSLLACAQVFCGVDQGLSFTQNKGNGKRNYYSTNNGTKMNADGGDGE